MNLSHYLQLVWHHKWLLLSILLGIPGVVVLLSVIWLYALPFYTAETTVNLIPTNAEMAYSDKAAAGSDPSALLVQTHIEYILSRPVAERTLDMLLQNPAYREPPPRTWADQLMEDYIKPTIETAKRTFFVLNSGFYREPTEREKMLNELCVQF